MIELSNNIGNIHLRIELLNSSYGDIDKSRPDFENWIPFKLEFQSPTTNIKVAESTNATFSVEDLKKLISGMNSFIFNCHCGREDIGKYMFSCTEMYFEIVCEFIKEDDCIEVEIWFNVGACSNGKYCGYDEGVRFVCNEFQLKRFVESLSNDLQSTLMMANEIPEIDNRKINLKNAYIAFQVFLERYYEEANSFDIGALLGGNQFLKDGSTADPAAWQDWINAVKNTTPWNQPQEISIKDAYNSCISFLRAYGLRINSLEVEELVSKMKLVNEKQSVDPKYWDWWMQSVERIRIDTE